MNFFDVLKSRRSIREFRADGVSRALVDKILNAGRFAPSAGNMQPWEFIVIRDQERIRAVVKSTFTGHAVRSKRTQDWIERAPVLLAAAADLKRSMARYGRLGCRVALLDTAAAVENMILAATALGLGTCWVSGFRKKELSRVLGLPPWLEPVALLPIGYPRSSPPRPHKLSLREISHSERYDDRAATAGSAG